MSTSTVSSQSVMVNFLRELRPAPSSLSLTDQYVFQRHAQEISATLDDPDFTKGSRPFYLPASAHQDIRERLKAWCESAQAGYQVTIEDMTEGRCLLRVSHP